MNVLPRIGSAVLAVSLSLVLGGQATLAQDLSERRGLSIEIAEPASQDIVSGETEIRAEVTARSPEDIVKVEFFIDDALVFTDAEPPYRLVHDFGIKPAVHVIRTVAHHRAGVTVSDFVVTRALDVRFFVNVQRVVLDVAVRDANKRFVTGLDASAFAVTEEARPQRLIEVVKDERPISVGVLLDTSGSMRDRMKEAQEAACEFISKLRDEDEAFVVDFDEAVYLLAELTNDRERLCRSIRSTTAIGGTALYDAIHAAYRVIEESKLERKAFVILSDGDDTESKITLERIREESLIREVTIYAIGLDVGGGEARTALRALAEETGGRAYFVNRADEVPEAYDQIAAELRSLYQVVYASDNEERDGRFLAVKVTAKATDGTAYETRHRKGYYALP